MKDKTCILEIKIFMLNDIKVISNTVKHLQPQVVIYYPTNLPIRMEKSSEKPCADENAHD